MSRVQWVQNLNSVDWKISTGLKDSTASDVSRIGSQACFSWLEA